jgi:hypothetical protein
MGASEDEIDQQINSTREQIDANLDVLERRAASGAKRAGAIAAAGLVAGLAIAGVAYLVYRTVRRPSLADRLRDMLPDVLADLPDEINSRLCDRPFTQAMRRRPAQAPAGEKVEG